MFWGQKYFLCIIFLSWNAIALIHLDVVYSFSIPLRESSVYEEGAMHNKWKEDTQNRDHRSVCWKQSEY